MTGRAATPAEAASQASGSCAGGRDEARERPAAESAEVRALGAIAACQQLQRECRNAASQGDVAGCRRPCPAVDPRAMKDRFSSGSAPGGLQNSGYNITQNPSSLHKSPDPQLQTLCRSRQSKAQHRLWEGEKREGSEGFGILGGFKVGGLRVSGLGV